MPKISVVLISYNEKDYIENAINSIVKQEFAYYAGRGVNLEIIIGDDGSDDGSLELIEKIEKNDELLDRLNGTIQHFVMDRPSIVHSAEPSGRWCGGQRPLGGVNGRPQSVCLGLMTTV